MKIEKVKNGFIVEAESDDWVEYRKNYPSTSTEIRSTEKHICRNLTDLLNFINSHYGEVGYSVVEDKETDINYK